MLLAGLAEYPLRRADVYDPAADHSKPAPPVYNRIGNDTEQIVFFGKSNDRFARALLPLIDSPDPELSRLAAEASLLCRDITFPGVNEAAGKAGIDRDQLVSAVLAKPVPADVAKAFRPRTAAAADTSARVKSSKTGAYKRPDSTYFRAYVEPVYQTRGRFCCATLPRHAYAFQCHV